LESFTALTCPLSHLKNNHNELINNYVSGMLLLSILGVKIWLKRTQPGPICTAGHLEKGF